MAYIRFIIAFSLFFSAAVFSLDDDRNKLVIGSYPYLSPNILVRQIKPLANFLEEQTQKQVSVVVLSRYEELLAEDAAEKYDLVLTPSHFALALWRDSQFKPVMHWLETFSARMLVKNDAPFKSLADLKNRAISIPDRQALVVFSMERRLAEYQLLASRDYQFRVRSTHDRALYELILGKVDAAIISSAIHSKLQLPFREELRVLNEIDGLLSDVYLLSPKSDLLKDKSLFERFIRSEYYEPYKKIWNEPKGLTTKGIRKKLLSMENYKPALNITPHSI